MPDALVAPAASVAPAAPPVSPADPPAPAAPCSLQRKQSWCVTPPSTRPRLQIALVHTPARLPSGPAFLHVTPSLVQAAHGCAARTQAALIQRQNGLPASHKPTTVATAIATAKPSITHVVHVGRSRGGREIA